MTARDDNSVDADEILGQAESVEVERQPDPTPESPRADRSSIGTDAGPGADSGSIQSAIEAATADVSARNRAKRRQRRRTSVSMPLIFRMVIVLAAANLAGFGIAGWSRTEERRFPEISNPGRHFPLLGKCSPTGFSLLTATTMALTGLAGYGVARVLETLADE